MTVPGNATKPGKLWLSSLHAFAAARAPLAPLAADDVDVDMTLSMKRFKGKEKATDRIAIDVED